MERFGGGISSVSAVGANGPAPRLDVAREIATTATTTAALTAVQTSGRSERLVMSITGTC
jgi:hypothetical protein